MKDIILKIIMIGKAKRQTNIKTASELSELIEKFGNWKDRKLNMNLMSFLSFYYDDKIYHRDGKKYTYSELFSYWFTEIYSKDIKK